MTFHTHDMPPRPPARNWRPMVLGALLAVGVAAGLLALLSAGGMSGLTRWAAEHQRDIQNAMARGLRAIQAGEPFAVWSLCLLAAAYGFVHAAGPGHGKILLGGAALSSGASLPRMLGLTLAASLGQSLMAIALVGVLAGAFALGSSQAVDLSERYLAPASYGAIAIIGAVLLWRGLRETWRAAKRAAPQSCGCGHQHGPTPAQVAGLRNWRDSGALIISIAIRPCTGALFLLFIAWRFDILAAGILAVLAMGLGTAAFNGLVATAGVGSRKLAGLGVAAGSGSLAYLGAMLKIAGGAAIAALSLAALVASL